MNSDWGAAALVSATLEAVARLDGTEDKCHALGRLAEALGEASSDHDAVERAFADLLVLASGLQATRAIEDVCMAVASASLPRLRRGELLQSALDRAEGQPDRARRVQHSRAVLVAMIDLGWGDTDERLADLIALAPSIPDAAERSRAIAELALALAKTPEPQGCAALLDDLGPTSERARLLALAAEACAEADPDFASGLIDRALSEARSLAPSSETARALGEVLRVIIQTGTESPHGDLLVAALDAIEDLGDERLWSRPLTLAIDALTRTALDPGSLNSFLSRVAATLVRFGVSSCVSSLWVRLAVTLASLGDVNGAEYALRSSTFESSPAAQDVTSLTRAQVPLAELVSTLVEAEVTDDRLMAFALTALEVFTAHRDPAAVESQLREFSRLFASPALAYDRRVALLDRALVAAQHIPSLAERVAAATAVANALSLTGATERGDAFFAGLVTAAPPAAARRAHLDRAVALVQLNRTADSLASLAAAASTPTPLTLASATELATAAARSGFLADALAEVERLEGEDRALACAQIADALAESTYLDPNLRVLGLSSLAALAPEPARATIECVLAQVRLLDRLEQPDQVLRDARKRAASLEPGLRSLAERQLVHAAIERISSEMRQGHEQ